MSLALPETIRLLLPDGAVKTLLLENYLRGVVAAALAADAPLEAMKALAVAARTFATNTHRHLEYGADVCAARHCQAWNERANPRAARAVMETRGIVGMFNDQFIEAFYFEHCDGKTRDAQGVLVNAPAYLKSVACPCGFASLKGHGIGMCLRGMTAMARLGESYAYILKHYYRGITLAQLAVDETTRGKFVITPLAKTKPAAPPPTTQQRRPAPRPRPTPRALTKDKRQTTDDRPQTKDVGRTTAESSDAPTEKPAPQPVRQAPTPRRSTREKIEQPTDEPTDELTIQPFDQPTATPFVAATDEIQDAEDFALFVEVEDVAPRRDDSGFGLRASAPSLPPLSFPEDLPEALASPAFAPPPSSMPEELPNALELEFIAPPSGAPEELDSDFLAPPTAAVLEPDLGLFIPPVEKFYTPLDAPPTMPEGLPTFDAARTDETPIAWVPPPPLFETEADTHAPQLLMDSLPGPRVIAGNLPKAGMLVTVRDANGNGIVTVSGVAKHYGAGGFEAPLTDDGAYHVKFGGMELDVRVENETVFIYYQ